MLPNIPKSELTSKSRVPEQFNDKELELIRQRRKAAGFEPATIDSRPVMGVALSGGGIRSATFCLGVFQSLARSGMLRHIDYLSTVSGGGYFGSFLGRMFSRDWVINPSEALAKTETQNAVASASTSDVHSEAAAASPRGHRTFRRKKFLEELSGHTPSSGGRQDAISRVEAALGNSQSPPLVWLRESSEYLAPDGASDIALDAGIYLRNWLSLLAVVLSLVLAFFLLINCFRFLIYEYCGARPFETFLAMGAGAHLWWTPIIALPLLLTGLFASLGLAYWLTQAKHEVWKVWVAYAMIVFFGAAGALWTTADFQIAARVGCAMFVLAIVWRIGFGLFAPGNDGATLWIRNRMAKWLRVGLLSTVFFLVLAIVDSWAQSIYAVVRHSRNLHEAAPVISGLLGLTILAPMMRSILFKGAGKSGKFKIPFQFIALAVGIILVLALFTGIAFIGHGFAWGWSEPVIVTDTQTIINPGERISDSYAQKNIAQLKSDRLIQVASLDQDEMAAVAPTGPSLVLLIGAFLLSATVSCLFSRTIGFLNLSSYHTLYSARLIRAYQGASNLSRWAADADATEAEPHDDIAWKDYRPYEYGGPLHLVNCAVNCTVSVETATESTMAKGLNLCVGPAGISYGQHHAIFSDDPEVVKPIVNGEPAKDVKIQSLPLGDWVGISGAAFTTGLGNVGSGSGTTPGTSLLCGLFNVRLGYWWKNNFSPSGKGNWSKHFPVPCYLADEFRGSFHIVNRDRWYLSDGGHFENTAAYELIRRRVPFIILVECGADPEGTFEDLGNLVRRVRIDFGAEIEFPDDSFVPGILGTKSGLIGSVADLYPRLSFMGQVDNSVASAIKSIQADTEEPLQARRTQKHAAIALVHYPEGDTSLILIIKPGLTGDEPADLVNYQRAHPTFPQQSTAEQFYDEAQWESYRKLGQHAMDTILGDGWLQSKLTGKIIQGHH